MGDPFYNFSGDNLLGRAKKIYNSWIDSCPHGKIIIHAASTGQESWEYPDGTGGFFTQALLAAGNNITCTTNGFQLASAIGVGNRAVGILKRRGAAQLPSIVFKEGHINLSFALGIREKVASNGAGWIAALGILGLLLAANSSD